MAFTTINDPSKYFQTTIYTGTGSNLGVTNGGNSDLQPDWVWVKDRDAVSDHKLTDSNRLASGKPSITLESNTDTAEFNDADPMSTDSFDTDGFTIGTNGNYNTEDNTYVAFQWKCNSGTTVTVAESGNNPANVRQTNTDAGFSIITYTGTGAVGTIAHGLGVVPEWIIVKNRGRVKDWCVYHTSIEETHKVELNLTSAKSDDGAVWNDTAPTSSVFTVGPSDERTNANDDTYVAYVFAPIQGYSKMGEFIGSGNVDGPFIYTGFKPAWLLYKRVGDGTNNWGLIDNTRNPHNPCTFTLAPNLGTDPGAASNNGGGDFCSNGWKIGVSSGSRNASGVQYIYIAFAESPFVTSKGIPATAR